MNTAILSTSTNLSVSQQPLADCLKNTYGLFQTMITNICTGQVSYIPLGFWDYAFCLLIVGVVIIIFTIAIKIILD